MGRMIVDDLVKVLELQAQGLEKLTNKLQVRGIDISKSGAIKFDGNCCKVRLEVSYEFLLYRERVEFGLDIDGCRFALVDVKPRDRSPAKKVRKFEVYDLTYVRSSLSELPILFGLCGWVSYQEDKKPFGYCYYSGWLPTLVVDVETEPSIEFYSNCVVKGYLYLKP
jgi:hypothetical protein